MRIRIVSDGQRMSTRVTDADTGEEIGHRITGLVWSMRDGESVATVTVELFGAAVDVDLTGTADLPGTVDFRTGLPKTADA